MGGFIVNFNKRGSAPQSIRVLESGKKQLTLTANNFENDFELLCNKF